MPLTTEALQADLDQQQAGGQADAAIIAGYWRTLIDSGVPRALASRLTLAYAMSAYACTCDTD